MITLRDYQQNGIDQVRAAIAKRHKRILYQAPCGAGKTITFSYIAQHAAAKGTRTCICVHREELLQQTSDTLTAFGVPHGFIAATRGNRPGLVTVAMIQTLARRTAPEFDLIVADECHHGAADTWKRVFESQKKAVILGTTATPCRMTGTGLSHIFQILIQGPTYSQLINDGYLVPAQVYAPSTIDLKGIRTRAGDFEKEKLAELLDQSSITGNAIEHYRKYLNGAPAIAFCVSVAHAEHTAEQFRAAGFRAASIDGKLDMDERRRRLNALRNGEISVLTSCQLISEGTDIPVVVGSIDLKPTKSLSDYLQRCGRVLRPSPGKRSAIVLDHVGNVFRHGLPDQDREWSLQEGVVKRVTEADPDDVKVRQCPACYFCHVWAYECPQCGYAYPGKPRKAPVEQEGELTLLTPEDKQVAIAAARSLKDFHRVAKACGYKPGWAWARWKARNAGKKLEAKVI